MSMYDVDKGFKKKKNFVYIQVPNIIQNQIEKNCIFAYLNKIKMQVNYAGIYKNVIVKKRKIGVILF